MAREISKNNRAHRTGTKITLLTTTNHKPEEPWDAERSSSQNTFGILVIIIF